MATKIICRATDCIFWENKLCTSEEIIYDPEEGCLTYEILDDMADLDDDEEEWEEDDDLLDEDDDWDDDLVDDDLFLDEDDDDLDDDSDWRI